MQAFKEFHAMLDLKFKTLKAARINPLHVLKMIKTVTIPAPTLLFCLLFGQFCFSPLYTSGFDLPINVTLPHLFPLLFLFL